LQKFLTQSHCSHLLTSIPTAVAAVKGLSAPKYATAKMFRSSDKTEVGSVVFWQTASDAPLNYIVSIKYDDKDKVLKPSTTGKYEITLKSKPIGTITDVCADATLGDPFPVSFFYIHKQSVLSE
jgi:hypothetical protein